MTAAKRRSTTSRFRNCSSVDSCRRNGRETLREIENVVSPTHAQVQVGNDLGERSIGISGAFRSKWNRKWNLEWRKRKSRSSQRFGINGLQEQSESMAERVGFFARDSQNPNEDGLFSLNSQKVSDLASSDFFVCFRPLASIFRFCQRNDTRNVTRWSSFR